MSVPRLEYDDNGVYRVKSHTNEPSRFVNQSGWRTEVDQLNKQSNTQTNNQSIDQSDNQTIKQTNDLGFMLQRQQFDKFWPQEEKQSNNQTTKQSINQSNNQINNQSINTSKRVGVGSGAGDQSIKWESVSQSNYGIDPKSKQSNNQSNNQSAPVAMSLGFGPGHRHYRMYLNEEQKEATSQ